MKYESRRVKPTCGAPNTTEGTTMKRVVGFAVSVLSCAARPTSADPLSPFTWAGEMSDATYSGTFSVAYTDGTDDKFSAQGSFGSTQIFAEMGTERNGLFVHPEDREEGAKTAAAASLPNSVGGQLSATATQPANSPKWRGKVPVEYLLH
jgi:hypothetical protein